MINDYTGKEFSKKVRETLFFKRFHCILNIQTRFFCSEINSGDNSTVKRFRKYPPGKLVDNPLVETFKGFTYATHHIGVLYVQNSRESSNVLQDQYDVDFETLPKKADYSVLATDTGHVTFFWHDSNDTKVDEIELRLFGSSW